MRVQHRLKKLTKLSYPQDMLYFDVESRLVDKGDVIIHEPYLYVAKYQHKGKADWFVCYDAKEFWQWCVSKVKGHSTLYMFAHNVTYDLVASQGFRHLLALGFEVTWFYENGMTFILKLRARGERRIIILNTAQFMPGTVESLGKLFGIPKLKIDYNTSSIDESIEYCRRDVEIIATAMNAWIDFFRSRKLAGFGITLANQAMKCYKHSFMDYEILIHDREDADELEVAGYFGGRSECFRVGRIPGGVHVLDVNSMYPAVMRDNYYPCNLLAVRDKISIAGLCEILNEWLCVAEVRLKTDKPWYPVRLGGKLIFPIGEFVTVLNTPELEIAIRAGHLQEVYEVAVYERARIFERFVDYFYRERMKARARGSKVEELFYKLIMNSLYGKFAQRCEAMTELGKCDESEVSSAVVLDEGGSWTERSFGGKVYECRRAELGRDAFVAISSHVTSYARVKLLKYVWRAGEENVVYVDTDSLFVNDEGYERLSECIDNDKLGYLKYERTYEDLVIHNVKDYEYKGGAKRKGIPASAKRVNDNSWECVEWPGLRTFVNEGSLDVYYNKVVVKELSRHYVKRWIVLGGGTVPLELQCKDRKNEVLDWCYTDASNRFTLENDDQRRWIYEELRDVFGYGQLDLRV